jgi:hypothetical protein
VRETSTIKHFQDLKEGSESGLPPFLFPANSQGERVWMAKLRVEGKIRAIGPRLHTSLPPEELVKAIRSSWSDIVSKLYPDSILSFRSALEFKPTADGKIFLTSTTNRVVKYSGLSLHFIRGPIAQEDDLLHFGFRTSSVARALLENLSTTRTSRERALPAAELERWVENLLLNQGAEKLKEMLERGRVIAQVLDWEKELKKLNRLVGTILGTKPFGEEAKISSRPRLIYGNARYDLACNERLEILFSQLRSKPLKQMKESLKPPDHFKNKAFFEAFFSNYIEGITFKIGEAEKIIFKDEPPMNRKADAQELLATYQIVSNPNRMKECPQSSEGLEALLKNRHQMLMLERPEVFPGKYRLPLNSKGPLPPYWVPAEHLSGTLQKGFAKYDALPPGIERAIFILFLVAEVRPFHEGNGRIARMLMNAELFSQGQTTIIIPNVYRDEYVQALRALTMKLTPEPLIRMLMRAEGFSSIQFVSFSKSLAHLSAKLWTEEPDPIKVAEL